MVRELVGLSFDPRSEIFPPARQTGGLVLGFVEVLGELGDATSVLIDGRVGELCLQLGDAMFSFLPRLLGRPQLVSQVLGGPMLLVALLGLDPFVVLLGRRDLLAGVAAMAFELETSLAGAIEDSIGMSSDSSTPS